MPGPERDSLDAINLPTLEKTFAVNTYGPLLLTQALLPNILESESPRLGFMSSRVGSITDNSSGGSYSYRASKTALNSICKNLSVELKDKGVVVVVMHPGIVKVHVSGYECISHPIANQPQTPLLPSDEVPKEAVEPEEAASKLYKILVSKGLEDSGKFWHREGQELPW